MVNEGCEVVHVEQETPVSPRERSTSPHTKNDISHFLLFILFTHCFSEIKTKRGLDISKLDFKASIQSHMRVKERKRAGCDTEERKCIQMDEQIHVGQTSKAHVSYILK